MQPDGFARDRAPAALVCRQNRRHRPQCRDRIGGLQNDQVGGRTDGNPIVLVPQQPRSPAQLEAIRRGGYVLSDCAGVPEALLIATGSEVGIAAQAAKSLNDAGRRVRLISMPCTATFDAQEASYRESVLPRAVTRRLAVEAGARQSWWRYVGSAGRVIGIDEFGASGKGAEVMAHFGFTADNIVQQLRELLEGA